MTITQAIEYDSRTQIPAHIASAIITLSNNKSPSKVLHEKLSNLRHLGYDIKHFFRPVPYAPGVLSEDLNSFLARMEMMGDLEPELLPDTSSPAMETRLRLASVGYLGPVRDVSLTSSGIEMLEEIILEGFEQDSKNIKGFSIDAGLDIEALLRKYKKTLS